MPSKSANVRNERQDEASPRRRSAAAKALAIGTASHGEQLSSGGCQGPPPGVRR